MYPKQRPTEPFKPNPAKNIIKQGRSKKEHMKQEPTTRHSISLYLFCEIDMLIVDDIRHHHMYVAGKGKKREKRKEKEETTKRAKKKGEGRRGGEGELLVYVYDEIIIIIITVHQVF